MAAGHGTRMGAALPKQFMDLEGKPILRRTIEKFINAVPDIKVVTVLPSDFILEWRTYCLKYDFIYPQMLVEGGITRFHSVRNALSKVPDGAIVAIHDGVRPLISEGLIKKMFSRMEECRSLIPVLPCVDTLKAIEKVTLPDGRTELRAIPGVTVDRSKVFCAQTPQMFMSEDIKAAYSQAYDTSFTDDASVASGNGIPLAFIEGERHNIKITTPDDIALAKAYYSESL